VAVESPAPRRYRFAQENQEKPAGKPTGRLDARLPGRRRSLSEID